MGENWAIVIGINRYDNLQDLKYAHRDAERVRDWCGEMGFVRCCFFAEGAEAIDIDGARFASEPSYGKVIRFLRQFENMRLGLGDTVWFFFAGHGTRWRESDYLMLSDSDPQQGESKPDPALAIHELTAHLRGTGAGNVVLMLDACRSLGGVRDGVGIGGDRQQGVITFYSCAPHQQALEIDEIRAGAFTEVLLEGLRRQGEGNCATVGRLRSHVQSRVPLLTERYRGRSQTPMLAVDPESKVDLILLPKWVTNPQDWVKLKYLAMIAEVKGDFNTAISLWLRVIDGLGADEEALDAIFRLKTKMSQPPIIVPLSKGDLGGSGLNAKPIDRLHLIQELRKGKVEIEMERRINVDNAVRMRINQPIVDPIPPAPLKRGSRSLEVFSFETCKVNAQGKIIDRKTDTTQCFREELGKGVSIDMISIPGGEFRNIVIPPFFMSATLITQEQWDAVLTIPQQGKTELKLSPSQFKGAKRPVDSVNWSMADEFCKRLSFKTGLDYRLPAEAQWEYACRSGTTTPFYFGETLSSEVANYDAQSIYGSGVKGKYREQTTDVESFPANTWGLYDMHGNVWEWCADHWSKNYETALKDSNPFLSKDLNSDRVLRGGSWIGAPVDCRSAPRNFSSPSFDSYFFCLRLVCSIQYSQLIPSFFAPNPSENELRTSK